MTDLRRTPLRRLLLLSALMGGASLVEDTATGNPVVFSTEVAKPLVSLEIPFTPVQSGTGDPSPQNVRPIVPWNGLNVKHGQNVYDYHDNDRGFIDQNGTIEDNPLWQHTALIPVNGHTAIFYYGITTPGSSPYSAWYKEDGTFLSSFKQTTGQNTVSVPENAYFVSFSVLEQPPSIDDVHSFQLFYGDSLETHSISFPSPVYGGTLDVVSGVLTVTHVLWTKNTAEMNNESDYPGWENAGIRDIVGIGKNGLVYTALNIGNLLAVNTNNANDIVYMPKSMYSMTQDQWKALALDIQIALPLETPTEQTLTGHQITALIGNNTIWSDADGSITAVFLKKA